jgi:hypothetical protein
MPSIRVRSLPQPAHINRAAALTELREHVARILAVPVPKVRALWQVIEPGMYLDADGTPDVQPAGTHPPTVELVAFEGRTQAQKTEALETIAATLARHLELDEGNAWVQWVESVEGELYTNGAMKHP